MTGVHGAASTGLLPTGLVRSTTVGLGLLAVVVKAVQMTHWPDPGGKDLWPGLLRQLLLITLFGAVVIAMNRRARAQPAPRHPGAARWRLLAGLGLAAFAGVALAVGSPPGLSLPTLLLVTAVGEEVLFRGFLGDLAARATRTSGRAAALVSVLFGLWHVPDASGDGLIGLPIAVGATSLASFLVLVPLRRRSGTVLFPALVHALVNGTLLLLTAWR